MTRPVQNATNQPIPNPTPAKPAVEQSITSFLIKWTPRAIVAGIAGYYVLGFAYELGLMATVDRVAYQALKHFFGRAGAGAIMPSAHWYSAWAIRISAGVVVGGVYDLSERALKYCVEGTNRRLFRAASS